MSSFTNKEQRHICYILAWLSGGYRTLTEGFPVIYKYEIYLHKHKYKGYLHTKTFETLILSNGLFCNLR